MPSECKVARFLQPFVLRMASMMFAGVKAGVIGA